MKFLFIEQPILLLNITFLVLTLTTQKSFKMANPDKATLDHITCNKTGRIFLNPVYGPNGRIEEYFYVPDAPLPERCPLMSAIVKLYLEFHPEDRSRVFNPMDHARSMVRNIAFYDEELDEELEEELEEEVEEEVEEEPESELKSKSTETGVDPSMNSSKMLSNTNFDMGLDSNGEIMRNIIEIMTHSSKKVIKHIITHLTYDPLYDENLANFCRSFMASLSVFKFIEYEEGSEVFNHLIDTHPVLLCIYLTNPDINSDLYLNVRGTIGCILLKRGLKYSLKTMEHALKNEGTKKSYTLVWDIENNILGCCGNIMRYMADDVKFEDLIEAVRTSDRSMEWKGILISKFNENYNRRIQRNL